MTITDADFEKLLDVLADNLVKASIYNRLHKSICASINEYSAEMGQSPTFWQLSIDAYGITTILMLCRVYDNHKDSLNLKKLLNIIAANCQLFEKESFEIRIQDRLYVQELSQTSRIPDKKSLIEDVKYVSANTNFLVKKLLLFRGLEFAHTDRRFVLNKDDNKSKYNEIKWDEVDELISRGFEIFTKYENLFRASSWSSTMIGLEDYERVLNSIRQAKIK